MTHPQDFGEADLIDQFIATHGVRNLSLVAMLIGIAGVLTLGEYYLESGTVRTAAGYPLPSIFLILNELGVLALLRSSRLLAAFKLFLWGPALLALYGGLTVAGLQTPILLLLPLIIMLCGWLLGARQGCLMLGVVTLMLGVIFWLETHGQLPPPIIRSPMVALMTYVTLSTIALVFGVAITASTREQYAKAVELGRELASANATLEERVAQRTAELNMALATLRRTQDDLIQNEKLASLGSMVAGISHELNTPIGTAVTTISSLEHNAEKLSTGIEAGNLKRSELLGGLGAITQLSKLAARQMDRASALIASFKQVAVDQVSERRREFDLRDLIDDNVAALRPSWKNANWKVFNEVPSGINCDSFPGALGQIVTNVMQNAVLHGFSDRDQGQIHISARLDGGTLELVIEDDGIGMSTATQLRAFEPFFTTKLGQGGSGLGLAVSHRIANTVLAGDLQVSSTAGNGSRFVVHMPLRTPGKL